MTSAEEKSQGTIRWFYSEKMSKDQQMTAACKIMQRSISWHQAHNKKFKEQPDDSCRNKKTTIQQAILEREKIQRITRFPAEKNKPNDSQELQPKKILRNFSCLQPKAKKYKRPPGDSCRKKVKWSQAETSLRKKNSKASPTTAEKKLKDHQVIPAREKIQRISRWLQPLKNFQSHQVTLALIPL